jgi:hypothetical protein
MFELKNHPCLWNSKIPLPHGIYIPFLNPTIHGILIIII